MLGLHAASCGLFFCIRIPGVGDFPRDIYDEIRDIYVLAGAAPAQAHQAWLGRWLTRFLSDFPRRIGGCLVQQACCLCRCASEYHAAARVRRGPAVDVPGAAGCAARGLAQAHPARAAPDVPERRGAAGRAAADALVAAPQRGLGDPLLRRRGLPQVCAARVPGVPGRLPRAAARRGALALFQARRARRRAGCPACGARRRQCLQWPGAAICALACCSPGDAWYRVTRCT